MEVSLPQVGQFPNNKICILPWMHIYGHLTGDYALCCHTFSSQVPNEKKFFGKGLSPLEAFNSDYIKKVRLGMLNGKTPDACQV